MVNESSSDSFRINLVKLWQKVDVVFDENEIINSMQPSAFAIDKFHYTLEREYTSASINVLISIRSFNEQGNGSCSCISKIVLMV